MQVPEDLQVVGNEHAWQATPPRPQAESENPYRHEPLASQQPEQVLASHRRTHCCRSQPKSGSHVVHVAPRGPHDAFEVPVEQKPSMVQQPLQFSAEHRGASTNTQTLTMHCSAKPPQLVHNWPDWPHARSVLPRWQRPLAVQHPLQVAGLQREGGVTIPPSPHRTKAQYQGPVGPGRDGGGDDEPPHPPQLANTMMTNTAIVPRRIAVVSPLDRPTPCSARGVMVKKARCSVWCSVGHAAVGALRQTCRRRSADWSSRVLHRQTGPVSNPNDA